MKIFVIIASVRQNRIGDKFAQWIFDLAKQRKEIDVELIDLKDYPLPNYAEKVPPKMIQGNYTSSVAKDWVKKVGEADGYIIVTPEYNHGYPSSLKNALDYPYFEWNKKPVGFISYGGFVGGSRAVEQLRLVAIELQMAPIREGIHFIHGYNLYDENGKLTDPSYDKHVGAFLDQLIWWTKALKQAREEK